VNFDGPNWRDDPLENTPIVRRDWLNAWDGMVRETIRASRMMTDKPAPAKSVREHMFPNTKAMCIYCGAQMDEPKGQARCTQNPERKKREAVLFGAISRNR
jgi:hypothetical protein